MELYPFFADLKASRASSRDRNYVFFFTKERHRASADALQQSMDRVKKTENN
jgi:hypothetical protein